MSGKPTCSIDGCCNNAVSRGRKKDGTVYYRDICSGHHKRKYNMPTISSVRKKELGETLNMNRSSCVLCGWDKAVCDRHRIKFGSDGGAYIHENVISVCPNCHRLIHMNLIKIDEKQLTSFSISKQLN